MRLFTAIDIPSSLKNEIEKILKPLDMPGLKKINPDSIHLTLSFYKDEDPFIIREKLKKIKFNPFYITIKGFGFFPNISNPRVLWFGVEKNNHLNDLKNWIKKENFTPHITVARLNKVDVKKIISFLMKKEINFKFLVKDIKLYKSELTSLGAVHSVLEKYEAIKE